MIKSYRAEYPNELHQLLVTPSRHLHILKDGRLKYQEKPLEAVAWRRPARSGKRQVVHYLLADHFSGMLYAEAYPLDELIPVEEFLYRAWSQKPGQDFCGLPERLSIPKKVLELAADLPVVVERLGVQPLLPASGFQAGAHWVKDWEFAIQWHEYRQGGIQSWQHLKDALLELLDTENHKISGKGTPVQRWRSHLRELRLPPAPEVFRASLQALEKPPPQRRPYPPLAFQVFEHEGRPVGQFDWSPARAALFERFYDSLKTEAGGDSRSAVRIWKELLKEDPEFMDAYGQLGYAALEDGRPSAAHKWLRQGVAVAEAVLPDGFSGLIPWSIPDNRPFLRLLHGLGLCYLQKGEPHRAVECFERILALNPEDHQGVRLLLGSEYHKLGNRAAAKRCLMENLDYPPYRYALGLVLIEEGRYMEAATQLRIGFVENVYLAELLCGASLIRKHPFWHGTNWAGPETACDYYMGNANLWSESAEGLAFVHWLFHHPAVKAEREAVFGLRKAVLDERNREQRQRLLAQVQERLEAIDDTLSRALIQPADGGQTEPEYPWRTRRH